MLNNKQLLAVESNSARILCLAGAGTGKTKTLISRVERFLEEGVSPESLLCLTFTRLAGLEMKERLGEKSNGIFINTFHSFCSSVIKENLSVFGLKENYMIYDQKQRESSIQMIIKKLKMEKEKIKLKSIVDCIFHPNEEFKDTEHRRAMIIAKEYRYTLKCENAIDIDLLILDVVEVFKNNSEIRQLYHNKYQYIFIDEMQDTNDNQMAFINAINPINLFLVGDDYQAIYGFTGAKVEYILKIAKDPQYEVIRLEENYRSTKEIVSAASSLILHNQSKTDKKLISPKKGKDISYKEYMTFREEIENIAQIINSKPNDLSDFCIITRTNNQINEIEKILKENNLHTKVLGRNVPALEHIETLKIMQLIEIMKNPLNDVLLLNYIEGEMSEELYEKIGIEALEDDISYYEALLNSEDLYPKLSEFIEFIEEGNLEELWELSMKDCLYNLIQKDYISNFNQVNLMMLLCFIDAWEKTQHKLHMDISTLSFLEWFKYKTISDIEAVQKEAKGEGVNLTTAHQSKGLEFPIVFMIGLNQGMFPHKKDDIEESRRLCFVAITRAKEELYVSWSKTKIETWSKKVINMEPSQFIDEMKCPINLTKDLL